MQKDRWWIWLLVDFSVLMIIWVGFLKCTAQDPGISVDLKYMGNPQQAIKALEAKKMDSTIAENISHFPHRITQSESRVNIEFKSTSNTQKDLYIYAVGDNVVMRGGPIIAPQNKYKFMIGLPHDPSHSERWYTTAISFATDDSRSEEHQLEVTSVTKETNQFFITLASIILAALSLYAQLTLRFVQLAKEEDRENLGKLLTISLSWIYCGIGVALLSLIAFTASYSSISFVPRFYPFYFIGIGLLLTALVIIAISTLEATITMLIKIMRGRSAFDTLWPFSKRLFPLASLMIPMFASGIAIFLIFAMATAWTTQLANLLTAGG